MNTGFPPSPDVSATRALLVSNLVEEVDTPLILDSSWVMLEDNTEPDTWELMLVPSEEDSIAVLEDNRLLFFDENSIVN